jgi:tetratricopeptide (TPR) repeat protein
MRAFKPNQFVTMKNVKYSIVIMFSALTAVLFAQNTVDGKVKIVPEAEAKRQSAFLEAERERMLGHFDKAIELYKKFLYDNTDIDAAWYGLARAHAGKEDLVNALDAAGQAAANNPDNPWYQVYLGELYGKLGRTRDAVKTYEGLHKRNPNTPEFLQQLAFLYVSDARPQEGLKALEKLEKLTGFSEEIADKKHMIYVATGEDKKAAAELQKLIDVYPAHIDYKRRLARFYETMGDKAASVRVYEGILKQNPADPEAKLAVAGGKKGNSESEKLAALKPLFADPKLPIDGKIREAAPYLERLEKEPALGQPLLDLSELLEKAHADDAKAWSFSGDVFYLLNRYDEALVRYKSCIRLKPKVFSVWENALGILNAQRQYDALLEYSEMAVDAFPNQPKAYLYNAIAALEKGKTEAAASVLDQALLMTAGNPVLRLDILDMKGAVFFKQKDYPGAVAHYEASLSKGGDKHPGILEHLGDAYYYQNENAKALQNWQKAAAIRKTAELERKIASGKI